VITHEGVSEIIYTVQFTHRYVRLPKGVRGCSCGWTALPLREYPGRTKISSHLQHQRHIADVSATRITSLLSSGK